MDTDNLESDDKKIEAFKEDLKALMKKHNATILDIDDYDGEEEYCGTTYFFSINGGGLMNVNEIADLFNS